MKNCENGSIYANSNSREQTLVDNRTSVLQKMDKMNCGVNAEENLTGNTHRVVTQRQVQVNAVLPVGVIFVYLK